MVNPRLEKVIEKGKWRFVLWWGVVVWGLLFPATDALWDFWIHGVDFWEGMSRSLKHTPLTGVIFGLFSWAVLNSSYKKKRAEERAGQ